MIEECSAMYFILRMLKFNPTFQNIGLSQFGVVEFTTQKQRPPHIYM
jgi:hypothetical protein